MGVRAALIGAGAEVLAPCPHQRPCPLVAPDWCHFAVRLERTRDHKTLKSADVPFEDEKFSYLIAARPGVGSRAGARIIKPPHRTKFDVTLPLSGPARPQNPHHRQTRQARVPRRPPPRLGRRDLAVGDPLPVKRGRGTSEAGGGGGAELGACGRPPHRLPAVPPPPLCGRGSPTGRSSLTHSPPTTIPTYAHTPKPMVNFFHFPDADADGAPRGGFGQWTGRRLLGAGRGSGRPCMGRHQKTDRDGRDGVVPRLLCRIDRLFRDRKSRPRCTRAAERLRETPEAIAYRALRRVPRPPRPHVIRQR